MSSKRDLLSTRPGEALKLRSSAERKFRLVLSVAIVAILVAVFYTLLRTSLFILAQQTTVFRVVNRIQSKWRPPYLDIWTLTAQSNLSQLSQEFSDAHEMHPQIAEEQHDYAGNKMVLVLDFWERMINVQSGLRRLVQIGVDSGFSVVEPFVYESKVSLKYAFPEHFMDRNLTPQTAALYFKTDDLYITNRYISHKQFRDKILLRPKNRGSLVQGSTVPPQEDRDMPPQYLIQAIVFINWNKRKPSNDTHPGNSRRPFYWCDHKMKNVRLRKSSYGHLVSRDIHVQRALCLSSIATVAPARFGPRLFQEMFSFVKNGTTHFPRRCERCVTLAFTNYRKHAFTGFVSHTGAMPFKQKTPPLEVGSVPQALAGRIRKELLRDRPYLALQLRTGKPFVLLDRYERDLVSKGVNITRHDSFKSWLGNCTRKLVAKARDGAKELGPRAVFYIASDMYNDGWKGGEMCPQTVREALNKAKSFLDKELKHVSWFNPVDFGIKQDAMGISGLADAAMCLKADRFMYAVPSNFGRWVHEQRAPKNQASGTTRVDCRDPRFVGE
ncbi:unnamed protein product [Chondrus crispus]|uniref:Uncharacterized protein n=1 Tax=Chondrus crispus TaxID=2769 RepID=R7QPI2_CHOCR|nr:unnamed protein product [Chondrus crispus]CDF40402.1 unnamed protein product [Chondrus crispus]|eukprot:XP_005710696.1 unnamed protein product [Chondrus crispus]